MTTQGHEQAQHEQACAQIFLDRLGSQHDASYELQRAEDVFPELQGDLRWDFVAKQEGSPDWIAIEAKCLRFPPLLQDSSQWGDLFDQIKSRVDCKLPGTIRLADVALPGNESSRSKLAMKVADLVLQAAPSLEVGKDEMINVDAAYRFRLSKLSNNGCSIRAVGKLTFYPVDPIERAEADKNVNKAIEQLQVARIKRATKFVTLLCLHPPQYEVDNLRGYISQMTKQLKSVVDEVFLINVGQSKMILL